MIEEFFDFREVEVIDADLGGHELVEQGAEEALERGAFRGVKIVLCAHSIHHLNELALLLNLRNRDRYGTEGVAV